MGRQKVGEVTVDKSVIERESIGGLWNDCFLAVLAATPFRQYSGATLTDGCPPDCVNPICKISAVGTIPVGVFTDRYVRSFGAGKPRGGSVHTGHENYRGRGTSTAFLTDLRNHHRPTR